MRRLAAQRALAERVRHDDGAAARDEHELRALRAGRTALAPQRPCHVNAPAGPRSREGRGPLAVRWPVVGLIHIALGLAAVVEQDPRAARIAAGVAVLLSPLSFGSLESA